MRILKINRDFTIEEIDTDPDDWMEGQYWDAARLDDQQHDVWVHDEGLFEPGVVVATVGDKRNLPLPAYVSGYDGEAMSDATMTIEELRAIIT